MSRPTEILIDKLALISNTKLAQALCPQSKLIAVVKADAYGHDAVEVAKILAPLVHMFAVSSTEEALELRKNGVGLPILLLEGCFTCSELQTCVEYDLQPVTHNLEQIEMLCTTTLRTPLTTWLKVDTGMHRLGVPPNQVIPSIAKLKQCDNVSSIRLLTHLSNADVKCDNATEQQLNCFTKVVADLDGHFSGKLQTSIANSAGVIAWPAAHAQWVRPGIMLYGLSPMADAADHDIGLKPVMTFQSKIIAMRMIEAGESVGYGNTWIAARTSKIATVAVGYGDGYPRNAQSGTPVLVNGIRCSLVGRVSMDMISVDVTELAEVELGDHVELWGANLSANEVANWANTIGYELVTRMPKRTRRNVIDNP